MLNTVGLIAQLVEQPALNRTITGSNPVEPINISFLKYSLRRTAMPFQLEIDSEEKGGYGHYYFESDSMLGYIGPCFRIDITRIPKDRRTTTMYAVSIEFGQDSLYIQSDGVPLKTRSAAKKWAIVKIVEATASLVELVKAMSFSGNIKIGA